MLSKPGIWKRFIVALSVNLEHGTGVDPCEHDDSSPLKSSDPQAEPHLATLATLCHSVFDVTVSRETQRGLAYTKHTITSF